MSSFAIAELTRIATGIDERAAKDQPAALAALSRLAAISSAIRIAGGEYAYTPRWVQLSEVYSKIMDDSLLVIVRLLRDHPEIFEN